MPYNRTLIKSFHIEKIFTESWKNNAQQDGQIKTSARAGVLLSLWTQYLFLRYTVHALFICCRRARATPSTAGMRLGCIYKDISNTMACVCVCGVNLILLPVFKITTVQTTKLLLDYKCRIPQIPAGWQHYFLVHSREESGM